MPRAILRGLTPLFSYSDSRKAWTLRGIGRWVGPVLEPHQDDDLPRARSATADPFRPAQRRFERARKRSGDRAAQRSDRAAKRSDRAAKTPGA